MKWKKANIRFPVETFVTAEKLDYPVVIIGHEIWLEAENKRFNYIGVQYPVGFIPEGEYVFLDHDQVEGILNLALLHEQHVVLSEMLDLKLKVDQILNNYEHITDWYDRDYDASDHVKHVAGIAVQGAFDVVIATVAVSAITDMQIGAAIAAGASETLKAIKEYDDGATTDEAVSDGLRKFGVDLIFLLGAGEFEILSKQVLESLQLKRHLIKYGVPIEGGVEVVWQVFTLQEIRNQFQ